MKKFRLVLLSAAIAAAASAFTTRPISDEYVKDRGVWKLKSMASGQCISQQLSHCTFLLNPGATEPYQDSDFTPDDQNRVWIPN